MQTQSKRIRTRLYAKVRQQAARIEQLETAIRGVQLKPPEYPERRAARTKRQKMQRLIALAGRTKT